MWHAFVRDSAQQLRIAALNLTRHRRRTLLALAIICGGVISFLLAGGFINWVLMAMREGAIQSQLGHIQITRPGYLREGASDPYRYLLGDDLSPITADDMGVRTVARRLAFTGLLSKEDATISFIGEGIEPDAEALIGRAITMVTGTGLQERPGDSVILGDGLAANIGAQVGDVVVLVSNTGSGGINAVELKVAGTFTTSTKAYDDSALRVPIEVARRLMRVEGATSWVVLLDRTERTDAAVATLRGVLPADQYEVVPWHELAEFYKQTVQLFGTQVGAVRLLIALIVILSISNTLSMAVMERTTEIGTLMALGVRRRTILGLFIWEGAVLGLAAAVLGVGTAVLLGELISWIGIPMPPPPGMTRGYTGEIEISMELAIDGFLLAFFTTLIASLLPAWKASRMNIVDALRHQA